MGLSCRLRVECFAGEVWWERSSLEVLHFICGASTPRTHFAHFGKISYKLTKAGTHSNLKIKKKTRQDQKLAKFVHGKTLLIGANWESWNFSLQESAARASFLSIFVFVLLERTLLASLLPRHGLGQMHSGFWAGLQRPILSTYWKKVRSHLGHWHYCTTIACGGWYISPRVQIYRRTHRAGKSARYREVLLHSACWSLQSNTPNGTPRWGLHGWIHTEETRGLIGPHASSTRE